MSKAINKPRNEFHGPSRSAGVAAVEFVVSVPILIFFMLAVAELGRAFIQYDTLSYSVRNSARFVSANSIDAATGEVDVSAVATAARNLAAYGVVGGASDPVLPGFLPGQVTVLNAGNGNIEVVGNYTYQPLLGGLLPMFRGGPVPTIFQMRISVTMPAIG